MLALVRAADLPGFETNPPGARLLLLEDPEHEQQDQRPDR